MQVSCPETVAAPTFDYASGATQQLHTFAAAAGVTHVLRSLQYSYNDAPTDGYVSVVAGAMTLFKVDVPAEETREFLFPGGIYGSAGEELVVTLGVVGIGDLGKLNVKVYSMNGLPETIAVPTFFHHGPAAATAATTGDIAAAAGVTHVLDWIAWSYDDTPTGGKLTVAINAATVFEINIAAAGPGFVEFPGGLYGAANQKMNVTLASGAGAVVGKLNVRYR